MIKKSIILLGVMLAIFVLLMLTKQNKNYISSCQELKKSGTTYTLSKSLSGDEVEADCILITAPGTIFDCDGHKIINPALEGAVINSKADNVKIMNCEVCASSNYFSESNNGKGTGILISGNGNTIEKNKVLATFWGISVVGGKRNIIKNNVLKNNAKGIHVQGPGDDNVIQENLLVDNNIHQGWGMAIWRGSRNRFINNKVEGSRYGLVLAFAHDTYVECDKYDKNGIFDISIYHGSNNTTLTGLYEAIDIDDQEASNIIKIYKACQ